jgi:hypothetical protein
MQVRGAVELGQPLCLVSVEGNEDASTSQHVGVYSFGLLRGCNVLRCVVMVQVQNLSPERYAFRREEEDDERVYSMWLCICVMTLMHGSIELEV